MHTVIKSDNERMIFPVDGNIDGIIILYRI